MEHGMKMSTSISPLNRIPLDSAGNDGSAWGPGSVILNKGPWTLTFRPRSPLQMHHRAPEALDQDSISDLGDIDTQCCAHLGTNEVVGGST